LSLVSNATFFGLEAFPDTDVCIVIVPRPSTKKV
jgi:hypothetical protein